MVDLTRNQERKPLIGSGLANPCSFSRTMLTGTLLVATDGLLKYAAHRSLIAAAVQPNLGEIPSKMVDLVRLRSGGLQDDVALVVVRP